MRWHGRDRNKYRKRYAWFPRCVEGEWIWLQWYWWRSCGYYSEILFEEPKDE